MSRNKSLSQQIGGTVCIIGAAAATAPGISDFLAGMQFNSTLHTTTIVGAGLFALSLVAITAYSLQEKPNPAALNISLCIAAILAGALAACYTAGQIMAYTQPLALPHTLSGMLMINTSVGHNALVGTEVFGTTLAFSTISVVLFAIGANMTGLLDLAPERLPIPDLVSYRTSGQGK